MVNPLTACLITMLVCMGCARSDQTASADSGSAPDDSASTAPSVTQQDASWRPLFDGQTTTGWREFRKPAIRDGWRVVDGALTRVAAGGDIVTTDQFGNFELSLEWKVAPGGNSGIFFHVSEDGQNVWESGPEMQILDDQKHADGKSRLTSAGANYALHPSPAGIAKPAGEWNAARLLVNGNHVEHWLNGTKVVEYELGSPDWEQKVRASKFASLPRYGRVPSGHIALQDHGDWVAFRDIKIRVLP